MEVEVNDENFSEEVLNSDLTVLVDFWAPWCSPCRMQAPLIEEIAKDYEGRIKVCKVNVDSAPKTASDYRIMSIPTLVIFKNGKILDKIIGAVPKKVIISKIQPYVKKKE